MFRKSLGRRTVESLARSLASRPGLSILDGDPASPRGLRSFVACDPARVFEGSADAPLAIFDAMAGASGSGAEVPRDIGYVAYDAAFPGRTLPGGLPLARFARYDALVEVDEARSEAELVGVSRRAVERLEEALQSGARALAAPRVGALEAAPEEAHLAAIAAALEHIRAGDVYQLNLARLWTAPYEGDPLALYLAMRRASPVPLGFFQAIGDAAILSRTMETFLCFDPRSRALRSHPIKGTRARAGEVASDDAREAAALVEDPKEQAEHSMIVDLMRNDLGRVAEVGSVRVEEPFQVEPYARLLHLVSVVRAQLPEGTGLREVFEATFPPGSVTGTPKLRAIRRIDELEGVRRGVYCGAVGHVRHDGGFHFAVAIRTALLAEGTLRYHAGGGIVAASDPSRELAETTLKAQVLLEALDELAASAGRARAR